MCLWCLWQRRLRLGLLTGLCLDHCLTGERCCVKFALVLLVRPNRVVYHDCIDNEPENAVMDVSEGDLPVSSDAEGETTTETPGRRQPKAILEGSPQDGMGIGVPFAPEGLPTASCTGGGVGLDEVGKEEGTMRKEKLPRNWAKMKSRRSGSTYYYNVVTGVSQRELPSE